MCDITLLISSLESLRSRFDQVATKFHGVRCYLVWESYDSGAIPVLEAVKNHFITGDLNPIIGNQAVGINSTFDGQLQPGSTFYSAFFVHEQLLNAHLYSTVLGDNTVGILDAANRASKCENIFRELSDEAARLLLESPTGAYPVLNQLLNKFSSNGTQIQWLRALFEFGLQCPSGISLRVCAILPKIVEVDVLEATACNALLEHVIYQLDCNPFSASSSFIAWLIRELNSISSSSHLLVPEDTSSDSSNKALSCDSLDCLDASTTIDQDGGPLPEYNPDTGVLKFRDYPSRKYSGQAKNCRLVLSSFQELGWPTRIDDPCKGGEKPGRVHKTVHSLNKNLSGIRFVATSGGRGFIWQPADDQQAEKA